MRSEQPGCLLRPLFVLLSPNRRKVAGDRSTLEGGAMSLDIDLSGYVFTREEWLLLDDDFRSELLDAAQAKAGPSGDDLDSADR